MHDREYGAIASIGFAVPQASTIVEPEMTAIVPDGVSVIATRLKGSRTDSRARLVGYLDNLQSSLDAFDVADLDAVGYACTGSSYIVGREGDKRALDAASEHFGYPVVSSAIAIEQALQDLGARRIVVFAPYPDWLATLSIEYWRGIGLEVVDHAAAPLNPNDTRSVYKLRSDSIAAHIATLNVNAADVVVLTGTGMPTLRAIGLLTEQTGKPVISSNLCLAWAVLRAAGAAAALPAPTAREPLIGGWGQRVRA